jgi:hypothetical protein
VRKVNRRLGRCRQPGELTSAVRRMGCG